MTNEGRHLTRSSMLKYFEAGVPATVPLEGDLPAFLVFEPGANRLSLRCPRDSDGLPQLVEFSCLDSCELHWSNSYWFQLSVIGSIATDAFPLLRDIADRVQLEKLTFKESVSLSVHAFRDLIAGQARMSKEQEIGLLGELLVLSYCFKNIGTEEALEAWKGWEKAEHDFDLGDADLEVKTTIGERRLHRIASATQLMPSPDRDLWMMSLQLTAAAKGGEGVFNLSEMISQLLSEIEVRDMKSHFLDRLKLVKWVPDKASLYSDWYRLRSQPLVGRVDEYFPSLTPKKLKELGLDQSIVDLSYVIDMSSVRQPESLHSFISEFTSEVIHGL